MRRWICLLVLACLLSGCSMKTGNELYALPKPPEDYLDLQAALSDVLTTGAEYAAPVAGANRQSVQLVDLDADGEKEAVAFFRTANEKPLRVCIFKKTDGEYRLVASIDGAGSAIGSVEYLNLDGRIGLELIIGWQVSNSVLQYMGAYSVENWRVTELMSASYSEYCTVDLNLDGRSEIFLIKSDAENRTGVAQLYCYDGSQMQKEPDAPLSTGIDSLRRVVTGYMEPGVMAVFVASLYEQSGIITDVFAMRDGSFQNVSVAPDGSGLSVQTIRNYYVYADDIDNDGVIELPEPIQLPLYEDSTDRFFVLSWYNLTIDGRRQEKLLTYHNYSGGWYLELPDSWRDRITLYRTEGTSGWIYTIARLEPDGTTTAMLHISPISGTGSKLGSGWFVLGRISDVTYAALMTPEFTEWSESLTQDALIDRFHTIRSDWNSGES